MEIKKNLTINLTEDDIKLLVNKKYTEDYDERYQNEILYFEGCRVNCNLK